MIILLQVYFLPFFTAWLVVLLITRWVTDDDRVHYNFGNKGPMLTMLVIVWPLFYILLLIALLNALFTVLNLKKAGGLNES